MEISPKIAIWLNAVYATLTGVSVPMAQAAPMQA